MSDSQTFDTPLGRLGRIDLSSDLLVLRRSFSGLLLVGSIVLKELISRPYFQSVVRSVNRFCLSMRLFGHLRWLFVESLVL